MHRRDFLQAGLAAGSIPAFIARLSAAGTSAKDGTSPPSRVEPSEAAENVLKKVGRRQLEEAVRLACQWLTDVAQVRGDQLEQRDVDYPKDDGGWKGAIRNEYGSGRVWNSKYAAGKWGFYQPVWHTGQACKALALAHHYFNDEKMLRGAKLAAAFLRRRQRSDPKDPRFGEIDATGASDITECCDGLFTLSETTGDPQYAQWACDAIVWVTRKWDVSPGNVDKKAGWALWQDGTALKTAKRANNQNLREIFLSAGDYLLRIEDPPGNWIDIKPSSRKGKYLHPRHAFWLGRPMWMAYRESGETKYRDCFDRACQWYARAMRHDGGIFRKTYTDFNTDSFGHASSACGCACMMFRDQYACLDNTSCLPYLVRGLKFLRSMQFVESKDPNLRGAILEKVMPPKGIDACPWYIRDIGTSFFVIAASQVLLDAKKGLTWSSES